MRILLVAPTCDGTDIGEAWIAHQWARGLAEHHEVTLLTYHKRGRKPAADQLDGVRVIEWVEPPFLGKAERLNSMLAPGYLAFYYQARRWIRRALARGEHFDVVHQPVPVAMRYPSPAAGLGLKMVIGPIGGGLDSPSAFKGAQDTDPWYVRLRQLDGLRLAYDPLLRRTYEQAACVLGIAPYVADKLSALSLSRFEVMADTALASAPPPPMDRIGRKGPVRALFVGRLVRSKGVRDVVRAMAKCTDLSLRLDVVGEGPERAACEALASTLGLTASITFHGRRPRNEVERFYGEADMFVFPSYREAGGSVVIEAMGHGLPLIVCDRGGPSASTHDSCAIRLPVTTPEALAEDVATAMRRLVMDKALRIAMGQAAHRHVQRTGLWEQRIARANALYAELSLPESAMEKVTSAASLSS
ncbi:glycosyltransferase family 4 protein [Devosia sp. YIM 151766]|uniref:glycosyltransferase family 4 protein n=1 Tax=Devosia sp. YIM 151766 TaxID=3017325 RepID=UPI00255CB940|nr:glycosyltransferase family 4 protein [Devosia sp. YIM 151766]WIY54208.1 glycosyltransferase family 4 protein [Devosia sp. YIM 151766]